MGAPKGNRFWELRSTHGRKPIFATPADLWDACQQYFEWCEDNPLYETKAFAFQGVVTQEAIPKMRAMTISGLCIFLGISKQGWAEYKAKKDFSDLTHEVEEIIRTQKFTGAAADLLNANIIARDLGLSDKQEHEVSGKDGGPIEYSDIERAKRINALLDAARTRRDRQADPE